ncbi:unnamed protein product [Ectocarpus sp. 12 AP-2014]
MFFPKVQTLLSWQTLRACGNETDWTCGHMGRKQDCYGASKQQKHNQVVETTARTPVSDGWMGRLKLIRDVQTSGLANGVSVNIAHGIRGLRVLIHHYSKTFASVSTTLDIAAWQVRKLAACIVW